MEARPLRLRDGVAPIGMDHEVEALPELNEAIHEPRRSLFVHLVVATAVNDEKPSLQPLGEMDGGAELVARLVLLGQPHEAESGHLRSSGLLLDQIKVGENAPMSVGVGPTVGSQTYPAKSRNTRGIGWHQLLPELADTGLEVESEDG